MNARRNDFQNDPEIRRLLNDVIEKINTHQNAEASRLESEMGPVQNEISLLRNRLIEYYREQNSPSTDSEIGQALSRVNTALSYVVGVEYPVSGIHRDLLSEAEKLLMDFPGMEKGNRLIFNSQSQPCTGQEENYYGKNSK